MIRAEKIIRNLKAIKAERILIQFPEGLKLRIQEIAKKLDKSGFEVLLCLETCYGACDIRDYEAKALRCDLILHIGHSDFGLKSKIPVIYEEYAFKINPIPFLRKHIDKLKPYKKICLVTTVNFLSGLKPAKKFLESKGKKIFIGSPTKGKPGQILGCDYSAAKPLQRIVDCFLFIGSGKFHPLGLALEVKKPVLFLDIERDELKNLEDEKLKLQKIRFAQVLKTRECTNFGILVSTKAGQFRIKRAEKVKQKLDKLGKNSWILVADEITPEKLLGLKLDCLVDCACPRIADDFLRFKKIILKPEDVDKL